jgi:hypothetical protein
VRSPISAPEGIEPVVRRAWRRALLLLLCEEAALPCAIVFAGLAMLVMAGTDIFRWYWLVLALVPALILAVARLRSRIPSRYRIAQILDLRLGLSDSLSTAWFLLSTRRAHTVAAQQILQQARSAASRAPWRRALPFQARRQWTMSGSAAVLLLALFALRYFQTQTLSLRAPWLPVHPALIADIGEFVAGEVSAAHGRRAGRKGSPSKTPARSQPGDRDLASSGQGDASVHVNRAESGQPAGAPSTRHNQERSDNAAVAGTESAPGSDASLFTRMNEALSSLLVSLRSETRKDAVQTPGSDTGAGSLNAQAAYPAPGRDGDAARRNDPALSRQSGQSAGLQSSQSSSPGHPNAQSGIGSQNGDKSLKQAQELAAMGKLTEILGKRSAGLTGDMTIRALAGATIPAATGAERRVSHEDLGGEIHRAEIPEVYRDYVRHYMETIHDAAVARPR